MRFNISKISNWNFFFFFFFLNLRFVSAAYAIVVRSSEYDLPTEMLDDIVAKSISKFTGPGHDVRPRQTDNTSGDEGE